MKNKVPEVSSFQNPKRLQLNDNYAFLGYKCFADSECDESPSAGWQFVKYCMRG